MSVVHEPLKTFKSFNPGNVSKHLTKTIRPLKTLAVILSIRLGVIFQDIKKHKVRENSQCQYNNKDFIPPTKDSLKIQFKTFAGV